MTNYKTDPSKEPYLKPCFDFVFFIMHSYATLNHESPTRDGLR